jgi:DNA polymerase-3 subunit epsilon
MREIALDTETTGLDPNSGHRVVEIGAVEMINHVRTGNHFHVYLNPERDMPREAEQVHGLSVEFLKDKPLFAQIADSFLEFLQDSPLIIHNAQFDMKFINAELQRVKKISLPMDRAHDTVLMARQKFPGQPASLDSLCKRFGIDLSARTKHGALLDAELLAEVYLELRGGRQSLLVLETVTVQTEISVSTEKVRSVLPARQFSPSSDELRAHQQMLTRIKQALWLSLSEAETA